MSKETKEVFKILQKYMQHVNQCEDNTFLEYIGTFMSNVEFTKYEINFLKTVEAQIIKKETEDCLCKYKTLKDGSIIKTKECNFHKLDK